VNPKIFPTTMIILALGASVTYAIDGDWRKTVYWLAAATLNFVVTY